MFPGTANAAKIKAMRILYKRLDRRHNSNRLSHLEVASAAGNAAAGASGI